MDNYRQTHVEIDFTALENNVRWIQSSFAPGTFLCPMVKADAYGHGDVAVASALESYGVKHVGVCLLEEGLSLKEGGVGTGAEILVFGGFDKSGASEIVRNGFTAVLSDWSHIEHLENAVTASGGAQPHPVHLKFDTGMHRLGFDAKDARKVFDRVSKNPKFKMKGVLTHLFHGEDSANPAGDTCGQLAKFEPIAKLFEPLGVEIHALNSAGLLGSMALGKTGAGHPLKSRDWGLRPGLLIYGANPGGTTMPLPIKPVMSVRAHAAVLRQVKKGESVSYGPSWSAKRDCTVAVVPIGYGDGYHRHLSNKGTALFAGHRVPVVGTVCMDFLFLDVTDVVSKVKTSSSGYEVVLFGNSAETAASMPVEELAEQAGTIPYELMISVGRRVPRVYKGLVGKPRRALA